MGLDLGKATTAVDLVDEQGNSIETIEVVTSWENAAASGWKKKLGMKNKVDIDSLTVVIDHGAPVNHIGPEKKQALGGSLTHGGNVTSGQGEDDGEVMTLKLSQIRTEDDDIDTLALVAVCEAGNFDKVDSATVRIWHTFEGGRTDLGRIRVPVDGNFSSVIIGLIKKTATGWSFTKASQAFSHNTEWKALGREAALLA